MHASYLRKAVRFGLSLFMMLSPIFGVRVAWADSLKVTAHLPTNGNLPGGTSISVEITAPSDGALFVYPPGSIDLAGTASVAEGIVIKNTTVVYALDRSGSMTLTAGIDCTGDGTNDTRDVCAQLGIISANAAAAAPSSAVGLTGVASYANTGAMHDVDLGAGTALLVAPSYSGNGNGTPDIEEVVSTLDGILGTATNFGDGLANAFSIVNDPANTSTVNLVFFVSDADPESTMVGPHVDTISVPANTTIYTFGIGIGPTCDFNSLSSGGTGSLNDIAALSTAGTGSCQIVEDISELGNFITEAIGSQLTKIEYQIDGGAFLDITGSASPALPLDGPTGNVTFSEANIGAAPGIHPICVRATGTDGGGEGSVTNCVEVTVADINLLPPTAVNELGVNPPQTHTVTAIIAAGTDGGVANVTVNFKILSGPNAGALGSSVTDGNGEATFTYTAVQGPTGLGTDVIEACFGPDPQGDSACDTATKEWVDTTAPVASCTPTTNPSGKNVPAAGNNVRSGQNPDGFYQLTATDLVDPNLQIFIRDSNSSFVAGPYASGTQIKLIQAPGGKPNVKPGAGVIDWQVTLKGDAILTAVDTSGNTSTPRSCRVPPPPK